MRVLSASEAIGPALERTKFVLFHPFRKGRSWKLAATAYLTTTACMFVPVPLAIAILPWMTTPEGMSRTAFTLLIICILAIESALLWLFFYFGARLEFVLFDIVLYKSEFVAPVWRKYQQQTWPWIGVRAAFGTVLSLIAGIPVVLWFKRLFPLFAHQTGQPASPEVVKSVLLMSLTGMALFLLVFLVSSLLGNFVLPSLALENTTVGDAIGRWVAMMEAEPGQVLLFCAFKALLGIVALVGLEVATIVTELAGAIPFGIAAFLGWLVLHQLGPAGALLMVAGGFLLYLTFAAFVFYVLLGLQGCVMTFFQAYAMYFLGGRYPLLGNLIDQYTPQPSSYPPDFPPPTAIAQLEPPPG